MNSSSAPISPIGDFAEPTTPENALTSEGGRVGPVTATSEDNIDPRSGEMSDLAISHVGRFYRFRGYRYERLEDAVAYARLMRARGISESPQERDSVANEVAGDEQPPDPVTRESMAALGVYYVDGVYCFADFRYDQRADAVHYALTHRPE
jgi:hypothetical protein